MNTVPVEDPFALMAAQNVDETHDTDVRMPSTEAGDVHELPS
jgi:hypothetical protein